MNDILFAKIDILDEKKPYRLRLFVLKIFKLCFFNETKNLLGIRFSEIKTSRRIFDFCFHVFIVFEHGLDEKLIN